MFKRLLLVLFALTALMTVAPSAHAQEDGRTPLMVVRFTKGDVYYAQQLYNAVSKAVQIKPDVMFDVIALAPQGVSAEKVAGHMVKNLNGIGVPAGRINVQARGNQAVAYPEVQLYVR
jgi:hypothetical protein